ncbi:MAG: aspartate--tRNA ligase [Legionellales bacterium]|jgi:aspartyl-tRNA synthetase|nr:aspartate--tRNA ligase [Legionellales bacterium]
MRVYCGDVSKVHLDSAITISAWVHRIRDHGGVLFVDCRDITGVVQVVCNPENKQSFVVAQKLRDEAVITITGVVRHRPDGTDNANIVTGSYELVADSIKILNSSDQLPFSLNEFIPVGESTRFKYRYLDLRRTEVAAKILTRAKGVSILRNYLEMQNFFDIETPILTKTTPEGARDYLVPSRVHKGEFYALPQSPQIFKQILMIAGFDRYYQVARCFRDEDLRSDRQPEFSQLDVEMSFLSQREIMDFAEGSIVKLFKELLDVNLGKFNVMTYHDVMQKYGSDKPDLRNPLFFTPCDDLFTNCEFNVFADPANKKGSRVAALRLPGGCSKLTRKNLDNYTSLVTKFGAKGLAYIKVNDISAKLEGMQSPLIKFLNWDIIESVIKRTGAVDGDILFFGAGKNSVVNQSMDVLRQQLGKDLGLLENDWEVLWVVDFPLFEEEKNDAGYFSPVHHLFTAPKVNSIAELDENAASCLSQAYDLVINGYEVGGGSIRIHDINMQMNILEKIGMDEDEAKQKFGHLLEALRYGCPPHGGFAFGLDRLFMLITGAETIKEVIAFPKTQSASCPLTDAPSDPEKKQLVDLGLRLREVAVDKAKSTD